MQNAFSNRIPKADDYYDDLLRNATIVVDTNVLLNMYRYSESTTAYFLKILNSIKDRVWVPYQVGSEFFENRKKIIMSQSDSYDDIEVKLQGVLKTFEDSEKHPFISHDNMELLKTAFDYIYKDLSKSKEKYNSLLNSDPILEKILIIYFGKVGQEIPENQIMKLIEKGKQRYDKKIPPGYMDAVKTIKDLEKNPCSSLYEKIRPYGDYIIWQQIIEFAVEKQNDILFITQDVKEDWFEILNGKKLGPRYELLDEFTKATGKRIHFYQSNVFLERITKSLGELTDDAAIEEVKNNSKSEFKINLNYNNKLSTKLSSVLNYNLKDNYHSDSMIDSKSLLLNELTALERKIDGLVEEINIQSEFDKGLFSELEDDINKLLIMKTNIRIQTMNFITHGDYNILKNITELIREVQPIIEKCENKLL